MIPFRRLLMAGLVLISTGHQIGCSDNGSNQDSSPQSNSLRLQPISTSLSSPVFMTVPPNDSTRLFIVQQGGLIRVFDVVGGALLTAPFLNVSSLLSTGGERGLLGMAFDPQYAANRQFYVFYTNTAGDIVIARYLRNITDPNLADSSSAMITSYGDTSCFLESQRRHAGIWPGWMSVCRGRRWRRARSSVTRITTGRTHFHCSGNSFALIPTQGARAQCHCQSVRPRRWRAASLEPGPKESVAFLL